MRQPLKMLLTIDGGGQIVAPRGKLDAGGYSPLSALVGSGTN